MQMQGLIVSSPDDFESLPPAVQRKFFSNLERFRLLTRTQHCAQSPCHHANHDYAAERPLSIRTKTSSAVVSKRHRRHKSHLRRRRHSAVHYNFDQAHEYWQCFHSLPPKIQKVIFSKEEQRLLERTVPVSQILDAADQALLKFEERHRASLQELRSRRDSQSYDEEFERRRFGGAASSIPSPASEYASSGDPSDSGIEMEESILDSFRWLDEDDDLDLSLDSYHKYVSDTAASQSQNVIRDEPATPRRMPSFRRTLSLAKNRNSMFIGNRILNSSQSSTIPFSSIGGHNHSYNNRSNQNTRDSHHRHAPNRSTSSIDPAAQYYQDPEARLKLRVYLASPQKFDEAIEFGFPSLDNKENINSSTWRQGGSNRDSKRMSQISASTQRWTFLDDESTSIDLSLFDFTHDSQQKQQQSHYMRNKEPVLSNLHELTPSVTTDLRRPQHLKPSTSAGNATGHRREMTLKMTLTRPDLRTHTSDPSSYDDPLRLAELPPADETLNVWDDLPEDRGVVKKMWRKLRGWRD